jgi:ketosteroid isomerase-like protein
VDLTSVSADQQLSQIEQYLTTGLGAARRSKHGFCDAWAVSSPNLDLVRSIFADWERGDYRSVQWAHPEIEYVLADGPDPGKWTGLAGMWEGWSGRLKAWEEHRSELDECRALDHDRVLALHHVVARGKTSGMNLGQARSTGAIVFQIRDGRVTRLVIYLDRAHALADLELAPRPT